MVMSKLSESPTARSPASQVTVPEDSVHSGVVALTNVVPAGMVSTTSTPV